jgi:predicted permease
MSLWSRIVNVFRGDKVSLEILEEIEGEIAQRSVFRIVDECRDVRVIQWLDSLRADAVFGWRQIRKKKAASAVAILSLGLAIGACLSAFRLIDAVLLRPLPVVHPEQLYAFSFRGIGFEGRLVTHDDCEYPMFQRMRAAVRGQAELFAISYSRRVDLTYGADAEFEKAYRQYVSAWMFGSFGLRPAVGRLLTEDDDNEPGKHAYAVLSYPYWTRRFGRDPNVVGKTFRVGKDVFRIVGVAEEGFTGTEPGIVTDVFLPTMMNPAVTRAGSTWFRTMARVRPGVSVKLVRQKLQAAFTRFREEFAKTMPTQQAGNFVHHAVSLTPAASGVSSLQRDYRQSLVVLGILVGLVLLIACANVANLMTAQAAMRAREMALRVSIGAGRRRLIQLVMVESAWIALLSSAVGWMFAWCSAPFVIGRINPVSDPVVLSLEADWRSVTFALLLTLGVTFLFGLLPAFRASSVRPASALRGGEDPHARRHTMHGLLAVQAAFCFLVLFVASLFGATFERLSGSPLGFVPERLLALEVVSKETRSIELWNRAAERLGTLPGVEAAALAGWPLLNGYGSASHISVNGVNQGNEPAMFLSVGRGWLMAMKIPLREGRDLRPGDMNPPAAIVNEAFTAKYFHGQNPVGKSFSQGDSKSEVKIVGVAGDARYSDVRGPMEPVVYMPMDAKGLVSGTILVRTRSADPLAMAAFLRREIARIQPAFRVSNIQTQEELVRALTLRERLLAMLALFFAGVAVLLAGIGLYGVLNYSVVQRRREIGIRIAVGAQAGDIARRVTADAFLMVVLGALAGLGLGMLSVRYIDALLYEVRARDLATIAWPSLALLSAALLAAAPAVIRAVRIDPARMLRAE